MRSIQEQGRLSESLDAPGVAQYRISAADKKASRLFRVLFLTVLVSGIASVTAVPAQSFTGYNCNWIVVGAEHINGTPVTVVINENLPVPKELCMGRLFVQVDFEEASDMVRVHFRESYTPAGLKGTYSFKV